MRDLSGDAVTETASTQLQIVRHPSLVQEAVFGGGLPGTGKSLVTAVLGSFERVEMQKYNYLLEHICSIFYLGQMEESSAVAMVRMMTDLDLYHMMMSRDTNFRPSDMSSVFKNPRPWRYLRRLLASGDAAAAERIKKDRPILHVLTHNLLIHSPLLFKAMGERLKIVEVIRHPLYLIKQWFLYIDRYAVDGRDFTISFDYRGHSLPFFARGWEERYICCNAMDRVIYSIRHCYQQMEQILNGCTPQQQRQICILPFEWLVLDPWPVLRQLENLLKTHVTPSTYRELRKQRVPRKRIADGKREPIYKQYGWEPARRGLDERQELERRRDYAAEWATPAAMKILDEVCAWYEDRFLKGRVSLS